MGRIHITHLTFTGASVPPAAIDFSPHVTVIHGPSDTGKSFIVDAIDFVLGAKELKEIPEREGYTRVLLGLELPEGDRVTLARAVTGGDVALYRSDIRSEPVDLPGEALAAKHSSASTTNVSRFLLEHASLDDRHVRKNSRNETNMLSFRDLRRLCLIGETEMQSEVPPGISGNPINKTKEVSVLKLLLTGEDDSALVAVVSPEEQRRLRGARQEVVERMLAQLEPQLQDVSDPETLRDQLRRLNQSIDEHGATIGALARERNGLLAQRNQLQEAGSSQRVDLSDAHVLRERFNLLLKQYKSDLSRLGLIGEAGTLLGYFRRGTCVFCGAEPPSQHLNLECEGDSTSFGVSVQSETRKTQELHQDLVLTIANLNARIDELRESVANTSRESATIQEQIDQLDEALTPQQGGLRELLTKRSEVEKHLGLYEQVASLEAMIRKISDETETEVATAVSGLTLTTVREFSTELSNRLAEWGYPDSSSVHYDRNEQDIVAGDQLRAAHGKGVRAILHAGFTISLAQYCFDKELPHPGFVVLDSPLVTYRPPDDPTDIEEPPEGVVRAFYRDIQDCFDGQVIVMENTDPVESLAEDAVDVAFTKRVGEGRYGFFSAVNGASKLPLVGGTGDA